MNGIPERCASKAAPAQVNGTQLSPCPIQRGDSTRGIPFGPTPACALDRNDTVSERPSQSRRSAATDLPKGAPILRQHRTIASASLRRLFAPLLQFEKREIQRVKKASQSLPPAGGKGILIIFCRGAPQGGLSCPFGAIHLLYLTENTYQAASLAPQRCAERNRRRRLLARSCAICTPKAYKSCARQTAILLSKKGKALF